MRYAPPGLCLNDFDISKLSDGLYHLIHIQGPPIYPYEATFLESSYGHATSSDLITWETKGPVFGVAAPVNFDDSGLWTMSILSFNEMLLMFYTGLSHQCYFRQQIGLAISTRNDGRGWRRYLHNPIVSADPAYYQIDGKPPYGMAWRDPFVVFDEEQQRWLMYIAAKTNRGNMAKRGCVGLAVSEDLYHWQVQKPILAEGKYQEMECPVIYQHRDNWYLFVSNSHDVRVRVYRAPNPVGDFKEIGVLTQPYNYAPRIISDPDGKPVLLHTVWRRWQRQDDGMVMRGMLAQPKFLLFDDADVPYLGWYDPVEGYFEETEDLELKNGLKCGLLSVDLPAKYSSVRIGLRVQGNGSQAKGVEIILEKEMVRLQYIEDGQLIQKAPIISQKPLETMKVLMFGEFIEVYCDRRLYLSAMAHRYRAGQYEVRIGRKAIDFSLSAFSPKPESEVRDDLNILY